MIITEETLLSNAWNVWFAKDGTSAPKRLLNVKEVDAEAGTVKILAPKFQDLVPLDDQVHSVDVDKLVASQNEDVLEDEEQTLTGIVFVIGPDKDLIACGSSETLSDS